MSSMLTTTKIVFVTLKELVISVRDKTGFTQAELGAAIGADGQTISNLETGVTRTMKRSRLRRLAELAQVPVDEVLTMAREAAAKPSVSAEKRYVKRDANGSFVKHPATRAPATETRRTVQEVAADIAEQNAPGIDLVWEMYRALNEDEKRDFLDRLGSSFKHPVSSRPLVIDEPAPKKRRR